MMGPTKPPNLSPEQTLSYQMIEAYISIKAQYFDAAHNCTG